MTLVLHDYWRSSAAYRVRIGLNLKGLAYEQRAVNLLAGDQGAAAYGEINPQHLNPALETPDGVLTQSLAILEWLEETHPEPPLLPGDAYGRATVRAMCAAIAADIHPLNNLRVLNALRSDFAAENPQISAWIARWIGEGFAALEQLIARHGGAYAFGDAVTLADVLLVPQVYSAVRYKVDLAPYPRLTAAADRAAALPGVAAAHPDRQPDARPA
ncbi:MAG: maleylacetoacetate isomerase [Caulobacteraceae bacterium]|nr:maleylacetoacetate isomerase [Caulobacteraceae bacterium]